MIRHRRINRTPVRDERDRSGSVNAVLHRESERPVVPTKPGNSGGGSLYMRRFVLGWKVLGYEQRFDARIINYAADFVICCRGTAEGAMTAMRDMMERLRLTVNEVKTRICRLPEDTFDFLGYTIGRCHSTKTGRTYLVTRPSKKRITRLCRAISEMTGRRCTLLEVQDRVEKLNRMMIGWANYFCLGPVSKARRIVDAHARHRLRQWLRAKHKVKGAGTARFPDEYLYQRLGLVRLELRTRNLPWAKA